ncbi:MFS transporter [Dysgonomonas macrotermitis]|uniref:Predicted arabinose efflux permease, MFS family n=1 Tax=Dysgonomonas macrotermitis TaxID=1346286 RepID=A0A1M5FKZ1_9BACT|nr:MFS transporter [Dysgonomonas macrotermitis]SHF92277.1 Predicted arabinose efflux permease, MFS family [Dysgonomonas macrotermitis]
MSKKWTVCLIGILGGISLALVQNKVSPCITLIMDAFDISMSKAGLLSSIFAIMGMLAALPSSIIIKKLGVKKAGLFSLLFAIVGSLVGVTTSSVTVLIISRVIEGFGVGVIAVIAPSLISMWFPPAKRGLPMGIWGSWMMVSQAVLFIINAPLTQRYGWQGMWWFGLGVCILMAVLWIIFIDTPSKEENHANIESQTVSIKEGINSKTVWILGLVATCFTFISFGFVTWISSYWSSITGWSINETNSWISLLYTVEIAYAIIVGFILNKVKNRTKFLVIGFIIYALVAFLCFEAKATAMIIALVFIYPMFDAQIPCTLWTLGPQIAKRPELAGVALGVLNIGLNLGTIIGAPVTGWSVESFGWSGASILFASIALIGGAFATRVKIQS